MAEIWTTFQLVNFGTRRLRATVTNDPATVSRWIRRWIRQTRRRRENPRKVVGLGVQWIGGAVPGAATLQLIAGCSCLIFQLHRAVRVPDGLRRFLANPDVIFVGVWNYLDAAMLSESRHHLVVNRLVDLRDVAYDARGFDRYTPSGDLFAAILGIHGIEEDEAVLQSNWAAEVLSVEQVRFACIDAYLARRLGVRLSVWNWVR